MDELRAIATFIRAAELGSFNRAATGENVFTDLYRTHAAALVDRQGRDANNRALQYRDGKHEISIFTLRAGGLMASSELKVHKLFSTPVLITRIDDAAPLNAALLAHFLPQAEAEQGRRHSNLGGWQSQDNFHTLELPAAQALCREVRQVVTSATALHTPHGLAEVTFPWRVNAWVNVNPPGASNALHGHPGAYWSAVYYVDDGGAGPDDGGALFFQDPRGVLPAMHDPLLRFRIEGCLSAGGIESIHPEPGMLVVFPAWLLHAVDPFSGPRPRVSVAFNFGSPAPQ